MECPKCHDKNFRLNGFRKDGAQRYYCKNCRITYSKHKSTYSKTERRFLSFIINFLENDLDLNNLDIKDFLKQAKEYKTGITNIAIEECTKTVTTDLRPRTLFQVSCKKPRLIICEENGKITLVKVPKKVADKHNGYFQLYLH